MRLLFACIFALVGLCFLLDFLMGSQCITSLSGSGISTAAIVGLASIDDVNDRQTSGSAIEYEVFLAEVHQFDSTFNLKPEIGSEGKRGTTGKPVLADSQKPIRMVAHDIPTLATTIEKGDITTTGTSTFIMVLGNTNRDEVANFIEEGQGCKFLIFYRRVDEENFYVLGTKGRPVVLSSIEAKDDKDGCYATCTFTRSAVTLPYPYTGTLPDDFTKKA